MLKISLRCSCLCVLLCQVTEGFVRAYSMFEKEKEPWIVVVQAPWSSHGKLSATEMCFDFH